MAIPRQDGSIILTTDVDTTGLTKGMSSIKGFASKISKMFLGIVAAATASTVAITKQAVSAYAEYEQLIGGIETLYKNSAQKVVKYARQAFETTGMSANEYMESAILFSARLIDSVSGDTEKAAEIANMALIDISDNANKLGTDIERVKLAYQGFARNQYVLLDNLALGYGGTKTEMERLLKDAKKITGIEYDIDNLADVYNAIHAIQEEMGIAGTTALEAEKTISGSAKSMKAAWEDLLSAMAGGGDLEAAMNNMVLTIQRYFENIVPVIEKALQGIGTVISKIAPQLIKMIVKELIKAIPALINTVFQMIIGLFEGIKEGISALFSGESLENLELQAEIIDKSANNQGDLNEELEETEATLKRTLAGFDDLYILTSEVADSFSDIKFDDITLDSELIVSDPDKIEQNEPQQSFTELLAEFLGIDSSTIEETFDFIKTEIFEEFSTYIDETFVPGIEKNFKNLGETLGQIWEDIKEPLENLWNNVLKPIFEDIGQWIEDFMTDIDEIFSNTGEEFDEHSEDIEEVIEGIGFTLAALWTAIEPLLNSISLAFGPVTNSVIDFVFDIMQIFGNLFSFFGNWFSALGALFEGDWGTFNERVKEAIADFANIFIGFVNAIGRIINMIITIIGSLFQVDMEGFSVPEIPRFEEWFKEQGEWQGPLLPGQEYDARGGGGSFERGGGGSFGDIEPYSWTRSDESKEAFAEVQTAIDNMMAEFEKIKPGSTEGRDIVLELDGRELGRAVVEQGNRESYRAGTKLLVK